jgi:hypothetical protein
LKRPGDDREAAVEALLAESLALAIEDRYEEAIARLLRANELCPPDTERSLRVKAMLGIRSRTELAGRRGR